MMASVVLDDRTGRIEVTLFADAYEEFNELLVVDQVLVVEGNLAFDEYRGGLSLRVDRVMEIEKTREIMASQLTIRLSAQFLEEKNLPPQAAADHLETILTPYLEGNCIIRLIFQSATAKCLMVLDQKWAVVPKDELLKKIDRFAGNGNYRMGYQPRGVVQEQLQHG